MAVNPVTYSERAPQLLSRTRPILDVLRLQPTSSIFDRENTRAMEVKNVEYLIREDPLMEAVVAAKFSDTVFGIRNLLRYTSTLDDVLFRQSLMRELCDNDDLYTHVGAVLEKVPFSLSVSKSRHTGTGVTMKYSASLEKSRKTIDALTTLPVTETSPWQSVRQWASNLVHDPFFNETLRKRRKVKDRTLYFGLGFKMEGTSVLKLKDGLKPEDVFEEVDEDKLFVGTIPGTRRERELVTFPKGEGPVHESFEKGIAHYRALQNAGMNLLMYPVLFGFLQLEQFYLLAKKQREWKEQGLLLTTPQIVDNPLVLSLQDIHPIATLKEKPREKLAVNTFTFTEEHPLVVVEGQNNRGKTEGGRTLHIAHALALAGCDLPASHATIGLAPEPAYISLKGNHGYRGSELERALREVLDRLQYVPPHAPLVLDEIGDGTNGPTGKEIIRRITPALAGRRVYATTHNEVVAEALRERGARSLVPKPRATGIDRYQLVPRASDLDFEPEQTLDEMGFTAQNVQAMLGTRANEEQANEDGFDAAERAPYVEETGFDDGDWM